MDPAHIYLFKINNGNIRTMCEMCSKLTIKTPEWRHWHRSGVFIVTLNRFHTLFCCLFLLLILNKKMLVGSHWTKMKHWVQMDSKTLKTQMPNTWSWNMIHYTIVSCLVKIGNINLFLSEFYQPLKRNTVKIKTVIL